MNGGGGGSRFLRVLRLISSFVSLFLFFRSQMKPISKRHTRPLTVLLQGQIAGGLRVKKWLVFYRFSSK